jgi:hypothetical protein
MKACDCIWFNDCRLQQRIIARAKAQGEETLRCWPNYVGCNDRAADMDQRCQHFQSKGRVYEDHQAMSDVQRQKDASNC